MNDATPKLTELTVTRTIPASPEQIYDVWLDEKSPGSPWFGPHKVILQPHVDGLFFHSIHFEDHDWAHYGRFIELDRPHRIQHTWVSEATRGVESVVTLTFRAQGSETVVTLHHAKVPDDEMGHRHVDGWGFVLGAIEERFAKAVRSQ